MLYVALLSGGKDSCYNLLHCAKNGHQLIAAASLGPGPGEDEIDSYLYQTVGQDAIQLVADALEVPLIRRIITGEAVQQGSEYGSRLTLDNGGVQGDETEDLLELLSEVKTKFPGVKGVSVGAILSNYQRVRVEHVCQRLSLIPLCYLWQRDQAELLTEMIDSGLEAIIIKVAGIGLSMQHLGKTLAEMQPTLRKLNSMYGAHICGEGGEYESLTLDLPLFKHRICLETVETVIHSDSDFATVAYLKVKSARLERKNSNPRASITLSLPPVLDGADEAVQQAVSSTNPGLELSLPAALPITHYHQDLPDLTHVKKIGPWVLISNIESTILPASVEEQVRNCFLSIQGHLAHYSLSISHIANMNLFISSMKLFPVVNAVYASFFGTSPPARACVAVDLPEAIHIRLECIAFDESRLLERQALHVQSLSYWAPANIGPYSQAIKVGEHVFVSGQIGLVPANNTLPSPQSLSHEVALSLRHVRSVSNAMKCSSAACWEGMAQCAFFWLAYASHLAPMRQGVTVSETFCQGKVPTLFVVVKSLPKDALVESQVLLHTTQKTLSDDDDNDDTYLCSSPRFSCGQLRDLQACWEITYFDDMDAFVFIVACMNHDGMCSVALKSPASHHPKDISFLSDQLASVPSFHSRKLNTISIRFFHTPAALLNCKHTLAINLLLHRNEVSIVRRLLSDIFGSNSNVPPVMAIPSRKIATWARDDWDYALCFLGF